METEYGLANVTKTATKIILKEPTTKYYMDGKVAKNVDFYVKNWENFLVSS